MKIRFLIIGLVAIIPILGGMLYVDLNYCYENLFPPKESFLRFPKCSDTFGVEKISIEIINPIYDAIFDNNL